MSWTCPHCERRFGATGQGHMCRPGLTVEQFLAGARPEAAGILERIVGRLEAEDGDLIVDPLDGKVLLKNGPTFCIVDSMTKWVAVGFTVRRRIESDRFSRKVQEYQGKFHHVVNLTDPEQIDGELLDWVVEAFHGEEPPEVGGDPMVPDDVDDDLFGFDD